MIQATDLVYEYPSLRALDSVSFTIEKGSITAMVGPNGAGKTTLLKCIAGISRPYSGKISVKDIDITENPRECHKFMGFLMDFFGLYDNLTVQQSLAYFAMAQNMEEAAIPERIETVAHQVDLRDKFYEKVGSLSRGMRQRLAIGQTIVHEPELLLLDEPASGLDPEARHSLAELFLKLNKKGMTLIVSSHILAELDQYANDMLIMRDGQIVEHRSTGGSTTTEKHIEIRLLQPSELLKDILDKHPNVDHAHYKGNLVTMIFKGGDAEQQLLLQHLVQSGVPISEFFQRKAGLQEQYLSTLNEGRSHES